MTELLPDIPRLYTAIAEWLACMTYILLLKRRISGWQFWLLAAAGGGVIGSINYFAGLMHPTFWMGWMIIAFSSMLGFIFICSDLRLLDAGFYAIRAFILAEFAASFEWQIHIFFAEHRLDSWYVSVFFLVLIYGMIYTGMYMIEHPHAKKGKDIQIREKELLISVLMGLVVFLMSNISFVYQNTPFSGNMDREIFYIRTLVDLIGVVILYTQFEVLSEAALRRELEQMDSLFRRQYDQYRMSKENDEMIGRMYHDLKHQIAIIRAEEDFDKKEVFCRKWMKQSVSMRRKIRPVTMFWIRFCQLKRGIVMSMILISPVLLTAGW